MQGEMESLTGPLQQVVSNLKAQESSHSRESTPESQSTCLSDDERVKRSVLAQIKHWGIADDCISSAPKWEEKARLISSEMEKSQRGIFMFGPQGRRKTTCATALLMHELDRLYRKKSPYRSVQFVFVPDLLIELQSCFAPGSEKQPGEVIYRVADYDFLVLDGMGEGGKPSEFVVGSMGTLIHHRHANRLSKRTVITSNFTTQELGERLDARISSRIAGMCDEFEFKGADRRQGE